MTNLELLTIGDASLDVFVTPTESETHCRIDDKECFLCFSYGDKIPVKSLDFSIGGNAVNNAVGTKRLGINSSAVLTLGDDDMGNQIVEKLVKEGVETSFVFRQKETKSNYSTIVVVGGERTIFSYKEPREYEFLKDLPVTPWIYLTSMGKAFKPIYDRVVEHVNKNPDVKLAFNPGSRQIRAGVEKITQVIDASYIVYVNRSEAEIITGIDDSHGKDKELLEKLSSLGPDIAIVTDGSNGSFIYDSVNKRFLKAGILPVDAHERTGAGDSFGAGCVAALIKGKSFEEALLWGTVNSASVVGYVGAQKGLLKEDEIGDWLERAKSCDIKVEEF